MLVGAIKDHPEDASLLEQLAKIHEGGGNTDKAVDAWSRVMALKPSRAAEEGIITAIREARAQAWRKENKAAIAAHNKRIEEEGLSIRPRWAD